MLSAKGGVHAAAGYMHGASTVPEPRGTSMLRGDLLGGRPWTVALVGAEPSVRLHGTREMAAHGGVATTQGCPAVLAVRQGLPIG